MTVTFETLHACRWSGARHLRLLIQDAGPSVYVGHPVTGISMARIRAMEAEAAGALRAALGGPLSVLFPMRSTHLGDDGVGANEYDGGDAGLFTQVRHFTLQNRTDASFASDAVLLHYQVPDDAGEFRLSRGIPFDLGWARARGRPVLAVIDQGNPNWWPGLADRARVFPDLGSAASAMAGVLAARTPRRPVAVEVFDFTGSGASPAMLAALAEADGRKSEGACAAIVTVMPDGRANPNWHGQVLQVSDWIVPDLAEAGRVASVLSGGAAA